MGTFFEKYEFSLSFAAFSLRKDFKVPFSRAPFVILVNSSLLCMGPVQKPAAAGISPYTAWHREREKRTGGRCDYRRGCDRIRNHSIILHSRGDNSSSNINNVIDIVMGVGHLKARWSESGRSLKPGPPSTMSADLASVIR